MERLTLDDMIKALRCVASQDAVGDCYADHENFIHMHDKHKRIICGTGEDLRDYIGGKEVVGCPYHQNTYGCCFEDGELYWLKDIAELLEELKSYKEAEEQGLLVRLPCKVNDKLYHFYDMDFEDNFADVTPDEFISEVIATEFIIDRHEITIKCIGGWNSRYEYLPVVEIGKTVFLNREEAKKKLKEMKK